MICRKRTTLPIKRHGRSARAGVMTFDMIATTIILGAVALIAMPMLKNIKLERRAAVSHQEAVTIATNIMEKLSAKPFAELTPNLAEETRLPKWVEKQLREPNLTVDITEAADDSTTAKQIQLSLKWKTSSDQFNAPLRLTTWVYDRKAKP